MLYLKFSLLAVLISAPGLFVSGGNVITCDGEIHHLFCTEGTILVDSTTYGRTDNRTCDFKCLPEEYVEQGCTVNVNTIADRCNGIQDCEIKTNSLDMPNPCKGKYNYYNTTYSCMFFGGRTEVCQNGVAMLQCAQGSLNIINAHFGRTDRDTCAFGRLESQTSNTDCHTPGVLDIVENRCQGEFECDVPATDDLFTNNCGVTYKYLTIDYVCVG